MTPDQEIYVADRVVPMTAVLDLAGITYNGVPSQIPCPVHKVGRETRKSARIFPDNFVWCYTCARQFRPTEVYAALQGTTRESAAQNLLSRFPVTSSKAQETLKEYYTPRKKPVPVALIHRANAVLMQYKHKVPLPIYKEWANRLHQLREILTETPEDYQPGKLHAFLQQMETEFTP